MQEKKHWSRHNRDGQTQLVEALAFRFPMAISEYRQFGDRDIYWRCPRCHSTLERDYQSYCDRCGQCLDWSVLDT